ncbi:ComF family protein [Williamsia herbipolensis]|uniref:ComF family protein n=1 Tax=Williamsia herbipolensis TaxID=1603258 RepID=A0AAU4K651_9NOCA|nr:ComF family protein [Williamsia herbipolensis]
MSRWSTWLAGGRAVAHAAADLAVPLHCGGCSRPGTRWCDRCEATLRDDPVALTPRVPPPVSTWAVGRYVGPCRGAVLALKEHGRGDLVPILGAAVARDLVRLAVWSELPHTTGSLILVPAPTRWWAARRRGGDPVTAIARAAADLLGPRVAVVGALRTSMWAQDSAGLSARDRVDNLAHAISLTARRASLARLRAPDTAVVLLDDVLTTGATATESLRVLAAAGVGVHAVLVIAGA